LVSRKFIYEINTINKKYTVREALLGFFWPRSRIIYSPSSLLLVDSSVFFEITIAELQIYDTFPSK
jgi:hypothetical protein